ncbi:hypothetical protein AB0G32_27915 [Streptomyces sp. NPDC023723]|uniref:hypothetical protein n=1 Tax=Streptomyces sp. NPDC023723 TaxID=3154323 RepID=UPI0033CED77E
MSAWITPRRLGALAVLYAVFVGGWYLGQPLEGVGCEPYEPPVTADAPASFGEPGAAADTLAWTAEQFFTSDIVRAEAVGADCDGEPRPRLLAWATGDWR